MVGGLTTEEIARAYHLPTTAIAQRIVRAKRVLRQHHVLFGDDADLLGRLSPVIDVIYLVFNEGYLSAAGQALTRGDLAFEARRLACKLTEFAPSEADAWALRALLSLHLSRWATRAGADGAPITLEAQDRRRWDGDLIADGSHALEQARHGTRSPLVLQAELAACHAIPCTFVATDWRAIVGLYDELMSIQDSPVVALNRAVAVAMADGPKAGLTLLDRLAENEVLRDSHRVWAVRADLHQRAGNQSAAVADYDRALQLVTNQAERQYLAEARLRALNP
jgi:predicted RNA polymerase sigma factor